MQFVTFELLASFPVFGIVFYNTFLLFNVNFNIHCEQLDLSKAVLFNIFNGFLHLIQKVHHNEAIYSFI